MMMMMMMFVVAAAAAEWLFSLTARRVVAVALRAAIGVHLCGHA